MREIPPCVIWYVFFPTMFWFSRVMVPSVGTYTSVNRLNTVVFPAPFGPIRPIISFSPMENCTSWSARRPPKAIPKFFASKTAISYASFFVSAFLPRNLFKILVRDNSCCPNRPEGLNSITQIKMTE